METAGDWISSDKTGASCPGPLCPMADPGMQGGKQQGNERNRQTRKMEGLHRNLRNRLGLNGADRTEHGMYYKPKSLCWETASRWLIL